MSSLFNYNGTIGELNSIGLDSAKSVIEMDMDDLVKRTDLEIETVEDVVNILKAEFEQE